MRTYGGSRPHFSPVTSAHAENVIDPDGLKASPNSVKVDAVTADKDGYVVVHEADQNGAAQVISSALPASTRARTPAFPFRSAKQMKPGAKLVVMLHEETGTATAKFGAQDVAVKAGAGPVQRTVTVE